MCGSAASVLKSLPLHHAFLEIESPSVHREGAISPMMKGSLLFAIRVDAGSDGFENEETVLAARLVSFTLHSILARHSLTKGAFTFLPGTCVRRKALNLSTSSPEQFPMSMTFDAKSTPGTARTHSPVARSAL